MTAHDITGLLLDLQGDNKAALDQVVPLVYGELRRLAEAYLRREHSGHTLQPTALIHEAYLRLIDQRLPVWRSRSHFFGVAAHVMRQILVDHARSHLAAKRGGGLSKVQIRESVSIAQEKSADLIALDDALHALANIDLRKCKIVELRFFGGLTTDEVADVMGISAITVRRELRLTEAWLHRQIAPCGPE